MFLKSIEIKGFKSFADKTEILFKNGITSIVGPNGSGKSNISDAVRWVLGEQSIKTLRGGKMEDVIFSGTQYRKAVGLSQVSLVLDNNDMKLPLDFSDITISRRLYRSGDSDYFINNTHCRLKDIQELFMDTGIGKEGYSIIGQGKIEAILSGKQEDRRGLLEEAAGIVKFRFRKEEAEKKLFNTDQNLIRINDILNTYQERLEPLREDSIKAEKFIELSESLKIKELNLLITSIDINEKNLTITSKKMESLVNEVNELELSQAEYKLLQKSLYTDLEKTETGLEELNTKIYSEKTYVQNLESDINLIEERLKNLTEHSSKNLKELEELEAKVISTTSVKNEHYETLKDSQDENDKLDLEILNTEKIIIENDNNIKDKTLILNTLKDNQIDYFKSISNKKNDISILENNINNYRSTVENSKLLNEGFQDNIVINSSSRKELEKDISSISIEIDALEKQIILNNSNLSTSSNNLLNKENELKKLTFNQNKLEANHSMLINLDKKHEGYNKAVKILFQDIEENKISVPKNSYFLIGDVIEVSKEHETAFEIALGGSISDIITDNEETAKSMINHLKVNGIGRATFLPLSIIKAKKMNNNDFDTIEGFIGIASNLISYDKKFENAINYLLGRTVICSNMDTALKIAKKSNYSCKIVTLMGEVINPSGSITGGSTYHKSTNVIGRKREIEELGLKLANNLNSMEVLNKEIDSINDFIKTINLKTSHIKEEIHTYKIEITKINGKINALDQETIKLQERLKLSNQEMVSINEHIKTNESIIENLNKELYFLEEKSNCEIIEITSLEKEIEIKVKELKTEREKFTENKIRKAQIDEIVQNFIENINRLTEEINEFNTRKQAILSEKASSEISKLECFEKIEKNKDLLKEKYNYIEMFRQNINQMNIRKIDLKEKIKLNMDQLQDISSVQIKKENELHRLEISKGKCETEKELYYSKLNDELGLTYAESVQFKEEIQNIAEYKQKITNIKSDITLLGIVNLGAIEEYKEIDEKINFMSSQRDDLNSSKEELLSLINDMTQKMKQVFKENFIIIRKFFNETFCDLFKGGSADLILAEGDELNGTIDIEVQPPGKKLQNINLLSGGEKGLSAIALLFAILKMKPTPFCILDEIEAALDDANVSRYADFLKKFSKDTQFIVITHRKGTMEVSDALYGVTMEEKGVSKVVSVDFSK